jgi:hypothetical protein
MATVHGLIRVLTPDEMQRLHTTALRMLEGFAVDDLEWAVDAIVAESVATRRG